MHFKELCFRVYETEKHLLDVDFPPLGWFVLHLKIWAHTVYLTLYHSGMHKSV